MWAVGTSWALSLSLSLSMVYDGHSISAVDLGTLKRVSSRANETRESHQAEKAAERDHFAHLVVFIRESYWGRRVHLRPTRGARTFAASQEQDTFPSRARASLRVAGQFLERRETAVSRAGVRARRLVCARARLFALTRATRGV